MAARGDHLKRFSCAAIARIPYCKPLPGVSARETAMNTTTLLGGMSPEQFLAEYWHKKPLLIRGALTDVGPLADFSVLSQLATREDAESRLIEYRNGRWSLERGPFRPARFRRLPETDWTLLVQGVNQHLPHIDEILWRFNFIPYARLDDLMISYAPPGGTVGPHFDAYDVFLLQVGGRKRWQISTQHDDDFIEDAPIRVLKDFRCEQEFLLEHGDMLYLPPKCAHHGVALDPGMTYSIGFRAPPAQELATQFLVHLQDRLCVDGVYADPGLRLQQDPARIGDDMIDQVSRLLEQVRWDRATVGDFLGHYLTEPKAHVFTTLPRTNWTKTNSSRRRWSRVWCWTARARFCSAAKISIAMARNWTRWQRMRRPGAGLPMPEASMESRLASACGNVYTRDTWQAIGISR